MLVCFINICTRSLAALNSRHAHTLHCTPTLACGWVRSVHMFCITSVSSGGRRGIRLSRSHCILRLARKNIMRK